MFFIHIFLFLFAVSGVVFFVLVKSFCKKIKKFKTDLITSFILLLWHPEILGMFYWSLIIMILNFLTVFRLVPKKTPKIMKRKVPVYDFV